MEHTTIGMIAIPIFSAAIGAIVAASLGFFVWAKRGHIAFVEAVLAIFALSPMLYAFSFFLTPANTLLVVVIACASAVATFSYMTHLRSKKADADRDSVKLLSATKLTLTDLSDED